MNKEQYLERTVIYYRDSTPSRPLFNGKIGPFGVESLLIYKNIQYNVHVLVQENY